MSEKAPAIRVHDAPDLTQDISAEVGTIEDADSVFAGDDTKIFRVVLCKYRVYESELPLCGGEGYNHSG